MSISYRSIKYGDKSNLLFLYPFTADHLLIKMEIEGNSQKFNNSKTEEEESLKNRWIGS